MKSKTSERRVSTDGNVYLSVQHQKGKGRLKFSFNLVMKSLMFTSSMVASIYFVGAQKAYSSKSNDFVPPVVNTVVVETSVESDLIGRLVDTAKFVKKLSDANSVSDFMFIQLGQHLSQLEAVINKQGSVSEDLKSAVAFTTSVLSEITFTGLESHTNALEILDRVDESISMYPVNSCYVTNLVEPTAKIPVATKPVSESGFVKLSATVGTIQPLIRVLVDGVEVRFPDQQPIIRSGRTLVPLRFVSEDLGATVHWDDATNSVTMLFGTTRIVLVIGRQEIKVNGVSRRLDVPAQIIGGRTMVPIRGIFESLGATVSWDQATNSVIITRQQAQIPGRIAFDPAVHVLPNGTMEMNKAIEFAKRALTNATFRFEGGNLVFNWVYEAPPELVGTNFEVDLWEAVVQGVRGSFRHEWIVVENSPWTHDSLEVKPKQSFSRVVTGLSNTDRIDNIIVRVGVRQTINGVRTGTGHIVIGWRPMHGSNIPQGNMTWVVPPNNRGALVQYDIRQLFTWLR